LTSRCLTEQGYQTHNPVEKDRGKKERKKERKKEQSSEKKSYI
jgi:hypothetical protein